MTNSPLILSGNGVGRDISIAPLHLLAAPPEPPQDEPAATDPTAAFEAIETALNDLSAELLTKSEKAEGDLAEVLIACSSMVVDPALLQNVKGAINQGTPPLTALYNAFSEFAQMLASLGGYMEERSSDLIGLRNQALSKLLGIPDTELPSHPVIIVARDLAVAETSSLDLTKIAGIVLSEGGTTGHTAIVARQMGIACIVNVTGVLEALSDGGEDALKANVVLDAQAGTLTLHPSPEDLEQAEAKQQLEKELQLDTAAGATSDGHAVSLLANIGEPEELTGGVGSPEGVGLFRTELLFIGKPEVPTVDEQQAVYQQTLDHFDTSAHVVFRTIDAGADKPVPAVYAEEEPNPALGVRGYRLATISASLIDDQLAAISRASADSSGADAWVMAPMIGTVGEAQEFVERARTQGLTKVGVMVEVPAAALLAEEILNVVDFVSIGTNDLAQYTMAADRLDNRLGALLSPWQPAILKLVANTATAGKKLGKPVGVCGESASDPLMALVLVGLGVTSLSMAGPALPAVRRVLRSHTLEECQAIASAAVSAASSDQALQDAQALVNADVRVLLGLD